MKKNIYSFLLLSILLVGCDKVLDKEPLDLITDQVVWKDPALIDAFLADLYKRVDFIEVRGNDFSQTSHGLIASMSGNGRSFGTHHGSYKASTQVLTSDGAFPELDYWKYNNIREANYFLEKIQDSPLDQSLIDQRTAEVRFLRAYMYFQMVIRYGGVPLILKPQAADASVDEIFVSRNSEKEVYDFIISEMSSISQILPASSIQEKGRPSEMAALALKSRAALFASSIAKYGTKQLNGLLGFDSSDASTYAQICYDTSKYIIDSGSHALYEVHADPTVNFQNIFLDESSSNSEIIMSEVYDFSKNRAHAYSLRGMPHDYSNTWGSMCFLYDGTERFEYEDGSPGTSISREMIASKEWAPSELWHNKDPRFKATVFYPESAWQGGKVLFHKKTIRGGETFTSGTAEDGWPYAATRRNYIRTGFIPRKRVNETMTPDGVQSDDTDYIIFRVGEIYLNLAEAALYLNKDAEALNLLNRVRQRAGMPPKSSINEEILQNERLVELTWENQSYWDLRRWRIAKDVLHGKRFQGLEYTYNYDTKKYIISFKNAEGVARTFLDHNYYLPLGISRITENNNFVENPGY